MWYSNLQQVQFPTNLNLNADDVTLLIDEMKKEVIRNNSPTKLNDNLIQSLKSQRNTHTHTHTHATLFFIRGRVTKYPPAL